VTVPNSYAASVTLTADRRAGNAAGISTLKVARLGHVHQYDVMTDFLRIQQIRDEIT
jgi:hypothetical protein